MMNVLHNGNGNYDNHFIPQYLYITDTNESLIKNITIFRAETLNSDMISYGFTDFGNRDNVNRDKITNYDNYLNSNSIKAINQFYEKDFRLFGYPMK